MSNTMHIPEPRDDTADVKAFGLHNPGVWCFVNSLSQGLMSCSSFIKIVRRDAPKNKIAAAYKKVLDGEEGVRDLSGVVKEIIAAARKDGVKDLISSSNQECAYHTFNLLTNGWPAIEELCAVRHSCTMVCSGCGREETRDDTSDPAGTVYHAYIPVGKEKNTAKAFAAKFRESVSRPDDYKCKCGKVGRTKIYRTLARVEDVLIVLFKKYGRKAVCEFPKSIPIKFRGGAVRVYRVRAQVEHSGTTRGGHYVAHVRRRNGLFYISDRSTRAIPKIQPTANTYMVFYEPSSVTKTE